MSRILVIYASAHGQTRRIAEAIAQALRRRGHEVEIADARARGGALPPPADYDAIVLGSRVQGGQHASEVMGYVVEHRNALAAMPAAFFSVSASAATPGAGPDPKGYLARMCDLTSWRPGRIAAFGGALRYREYGWVLRWIMKVMSRRDHLPTDTSRDHELTDWQAVTRFADDFADDLARLARSVQPRRA